MIGYHLESGAGGERGSFEIGHPRSRGLKNFGRSWIRRVRGLENWTIFMDVICVSSLMSHHQNPRPNMIAEPFKFNSRESNANESVSKFLAELRKLTEYCEYGDSLNDMLRDRLVCSINHVRTQQRLLSEGSILSTISQKALDISLSLESAIGQKAAIQRVLLKPPTTDPPTTDPPAHRPLTTYPPTHGPFIHQLTLKQKTRF